MQSYILKPLRSLFVPPVCLFLDENGRFSSQPGPSHNPWWNSPKVQEFLNGYSSSYKEGYTLLGISMGYQFLARISPTAPVSHTMIKYVAENFGPNFFWGALANTIAIAVIRQYRKSPADQSSTIGPPSYKVGRATNYVLPFILACSVSAHDYIKYNRSVMSEDTTHTLIAENSNSSMLPACPKKLKKIGTASFIMNPAL